MVGITPVASQVARARRYAALRGLSERAAFEQADYTGTPFPDASFDVVWALESLCHAVEKAAFYQEAARLLRPGGRLVVAEYIRAERPLRAPGERLLHEWLDGWAIGDLDTRDEHERHAAAAGFAEAHSAAAERPNSAACSAATLSTSARLSVSSTISRWMTQ